MHYLLLPGYSAIHNILLTHYTYLGFVEVNLQIPGIQPYNEDVLLLDIPTMTYSKMVPVMVGSKIIDRALSLIMNGEFEEVTMMWRQAHFGDVMLDHCSCRVQTKAKQGWKKR